MKALQSCGYGHTGCMAFEHEVDVARQLAEEAGALALDYQRAGVAIETKSDESPVTAADRAVENLIVERLTKIFPKDGLLGEEGANRKSKNGRTWIIDPIDGTKDFIRGIPLWAVLIGFEQDGAIVAGAAYCPGQNLSLSARRGGGTWANGEQVRIRDQADRHKAVLCFNGFNKLGVGRFQSKLVDWVGEFWAVRGFGGSVDAMTLAQGKADIWIEPNAAPWDLAPLKILVEEAGARFASFEGNNSIYDGNAYACVPGLEAYVQELLQTGRNNKF